MTNLPLPTRLAIHRLARLGRDPARRDAIDADLGTRHGRSLFIWVLDYGGNNKAGKWKRGGSRCIWWFDCRWCSKCYVQVQQRHHNRVRDTNMVNSWQHQDESPDCLKKKKKRVAAVNNRRIEKTNKKQVRRDEWPADNLPNGGAEMRGGGKSWTKHSTFPGLFGLPANFNATRAAPKARSIPFSTLRLSLFFFTLSWLMISSSSFLLCHDHSTELREKRPLKMPQEIYIAYTCRKVQRLQILTTTNY